MLSSLAIAISLTGCHRAREEARDQSIAGLRDLCSSCHGMGGRSTPPEFPNLAGQQTDYLVLRLKSLRDDSLADPHPPTHMRLMASFLDDAKIGVVARYYAAQPPAPGQPPTPAGATIGKDIITLGVASRGVPACSGCHGEHGEGKGAIPRIAGQHSAYLTEQLTRFRGNARVNETMRHNVFNLTDAEISAVSEYAQSL